MAPLRVDATDIERMAEATFLSYGANSREKISRFWVLLLLSGIIATAGVASNSAATVIGAMIVAPLMTPILGAAYALVLADQRYLLHSLLTVAGGALLVIAIAFLFGLSEPLDVLTEDNSQVYSRVQPHLIDLLAALATGSVGAFALVRSDVSDTLPGVAIAISLVPPLAVVGLTLEDGNTYKALGALLLFATNVAAMVFTATMCLLLYRVRATALDAGFAIGRLRGWGLAAVVAMVAVVAIPLAFGTLQVFRENLLKFHSAPVAEDWAQANNWRVTSLQVDEQEVLITAIGPPPKIAPESLRKAFDEAGLSEFDLTIKLIVGDTQHIPGTESDSEGDE
jgi:uncharacterized hydrophobic protein (TIGR00271 family)